MALLNLWPTPTSGGKANAIEFRPEADEEGRILLVMTDDEQGWVMILEWDSSSLENPIKLISKSLIDKLGVGASHAVWLWSWRRARVSHLLNVLFLPLLYFYFYYDDDDDVDVDLSAVPVFFEWYSSELGLQT